jgi:hypothetical protein
MREYWGYIFSAYGIAALVLAWVAVSSVAAWRKVKGRE